MCGQGKLLCGVQRGKYSFQDHNSSDRVSCTGRYLSRLFSACGTQVVRHVSSGHLPLSRSNIRPTRHGTWLRYSTALLIPVIVVSPQNMSELLQDILPLEKAEDLLACLLEVSRGWTTQPWYTSSGIEGRSHSRSRAFHIPTTGDYRRVSGTDPNNVPANVKAREAERISRPTTASEIRASAAIPTGAVLSGSTDERFQSSESEEFDYDACPQDEEASAVSVGPTSGVRQSFTERLHDETNEVLPGSEPQKMVAGTSNNTARSSTSEHLKPSERLDVAPPELLEIVPVVVEAVRR